MTELPDRLVAALADRYDLIRPLGAGGMATVYLARDLKHDRQVAVKVLRPELAAVIGGERFVAEIKTTAALQHPHILPLFDSGEADGFLYYVMPYVEGETLRGRLDREKQLGVDEALQITRDVADALDYAHRQGVVHRDIKPENILLQDGRPVVADFGIAVAISAAGGGRMTETGLSLGTPHYMSPEQATADQDVSPRSDVYSLACVLYEMLAGDPPHTARTAQAIIVRILTETPRPVTDTRPTVPPHVAAVLSKALQKLPADRFESAADFRAAIDRTDFTFVVPDRTGVRSGEQARHAAHHGDGRESTGPSGLFRWAPWAVAGVAVIAFLASTLLSGSSSGPETTSRLDLSFGDLEIPPMQTVEISPDGSMLVVSGIREGQRALFLRRIDEADWVRIPGTEEGFYPVFSPDSEWVLYKDGRDRTLVRVAPDGGGSLTVFEDEDVEPFFAHWGADGQIVFSGPQQHMVIGMDGSRQAIPAIGVRVFLLPDGRGVLGGAGNDVRIHDMDRDSTWTLIPGGTQPVYVDTGHILYVGSGGGLYAQGFDLPSRELRGSPVRVLDRVAYTWGDRGFAVSGTGTLIHSEGEPLAGAAGTSTNRFLLVDSLGGTDTIPLPPARRATPRFSPDGRFIVYEDYSGGNDSQIHTFDLATGYDQAVTFEGDNEQPVFSPDGSRLAFDVELPGDDEDIHVKWTDNRAPKERLFALEGEQNALEWLSPDTLLFENVTGGNSDLMLALLEGDSVRIQPYLRTPFDEFEARVSPDRTLAVYESNESGEYETWLRTFPVPTGKWRVSNGVGVNPGWAPDGSGIYFWTMTSPGSGWKLKFVPLYREPSIRVGAVRDIPVPAGVSENDWDIHPDGDRYLITVPYQAARGAGTAADGESRPPRTLVVLNWFEELTARIGGER